MKIPDEFENKITEFAVTSGLFDSAAKVLLAVSGGADSTALMHLMQALKDKGVFGVEMLCAHINHQLRGVEADKDEDFVITEAAKLKLPVITRRVDVRDFARRNKLSIETAARKLRIEILLDIAKDNNCDCVATAHQKNDNAETILQRLIRGTGFRGLGGIWPKRVFEGVNFVRPLLCVERDEIIEYLEKQNLNWRDDHTNIDCSYRRNFIRHRLIPALQRECKNSIVEQLFDLSGSAQRLYSLVCESVDNVWPKLAEVSSERVSLGLKRFSAQPQPIEVELIRRSLIKAGCGEANLTQRHYEKILQLAKSNVGGRKIELPGGFIVQREYENLVFSRRGECSIQISEPEKLEIPGQTKFGQYLIEATIVDAGLEKGLTADHAKLAETRSGEANKGRAGLAPPKESGGVNPTLQNSAVSADSVVKGRYVELFDLDKVKLPLFVRYRRAGDRFWPLGLAGEKKVGKFLTAAKVLGQMRKKALIVADSGKIIWVWPIRISEQAKISGETKRILQLQICNVNSAQHM